MVDSLVLITGATGFIGAHVVNQTLEAGYRVRATARPPKVDALREKYGGKVDVVGIADIANGDYSEALKDVDAILHIAAPLPGKADAAGMIDGAVGGSLNIIRQAAAKGVKRVVLTSTMLAMLNLDNVASIVFDTSRVMTDKEWNPATKEAALSGERDPAWIYSAAKTVAEQEVWKFADEHPETDITALLPPVVYGPLADTNIPKGDFGAMSMDGFFYSNVFPKGGSSVEIAPQFDAMPFFLYTIDVRDVAKAHVLALKAPLEKEVGRKRIVIAGKPISWLDAVEHLRATRPDLAGRLPDTSKASRRPIASVDLSRAESVLGLTEYIDWKDTVDATADSVLAVEAAWAKADNDN
ncbi:NAD(P)-binding protein [Schizopora paradoxa]|uniref:NAD(P)-binding protein n=1 Tax=Schizopora paradoxa TaxID=27342 RepID=A0A0H2SBR2_9AGAM|nr:NAD(P)-binding protein [Schizopora paradoxa]